MSLKEKLELLLYQLEVELNPKCPIALVETKSYRKIMALFDYVNPAIEYKGFVEYLKRLGIDDEGNGK